MEQQERNQSLKDASKAKATTTQPHNRVIQPNTSNQYMHTHKQNTLLGLQEHIAPVAGSSTQASLIFRTFLPWFLVELLLLLSAGAWCLDLAIQTQQIGWLFGVVVAISISTWLAHRFSEGVLVFIGACVLFRKGFFWRKEYRVWRGAGQFSLIQSALGRFLDYGTVHYVDVHGIHLARFVANMTLLRALIEIHWASDRPNCTGDEGHERGR